MRNSYIKLLIRTKTFEENIDLENIKFEEGFMQSKKILYDIIKEEAK